MLSRGGEVGRGRPPYGRSSHSGTESSNPAPSSRESVANLTSSPCRLPVDPASRRDGRSYLGLLTVERFFLPENLRRGGLGGRMLAMAEEEGRRRGCTRAVLSTLHFLHDPSRNDVAMSNRRWRQASIIMIANSPRAGSWPYALHRVTPRQRRDIGAVRSGKRRPGPEDEFAS